MDPTTILAAAGPLAELARDMLLSAIGAIIGGRLGWLYWRRERRVMCRRYTPSLRVRLGRLAAWLRA